MKKIISIGIVYMIFSLIFLTPISAATVTAGEVSQTFCGGGINVKDSLILSIVTMCLGGILEKTQEWREIKCQAIVCHYEAVKYDLDPAFCDVQEQYLTCSFIVGEVFAFPPMSILEHYRQLMANIIANPVGAAFGAAVTFSKKQLKACVAAGSCVYTPSKPLDYISAGVVLTADTLSIIQTIMDIFENGFSFGAEENACDEVEDIKKEMEGILGIQSDDDGDDGGFLGIF